MMNIESVYAYLIGYYVFVIYFTFLVIDKPMSFERALFRFLIVCIIALVYPVFILYMLFNLINWLMSATEKDYGEEKDDNATK